MTAPPCRQSYSLDGPWQFAYSLETPPNITTIADLGSSGLVLLPCNVPGNFELDLLQNGIIEEPFFGMNIASLRKYESAHTWYARTFTIAAVDRALTTLVFDGIDCISEIYLNGNLLGATDNMLVEHSFAVDGLLLAENELLIHILPSCLQANKYDYPQSVHTLRHCYDSLYIRKAPHMYGWDIMPRALSAGIWRSVTLYSVPAEHIESIFLKTLSIAGDHSSAKLRLSYNLRIEDCSSDDYTISIQGVAGDCNFLADEALVFGHGQMTVEVANPKLWWPRSRGDASLYTVTITLSKNGNLLDTVTFRTGIRTAELDRTSVTDSDGSGEFCFWINGEKTFILGTNWVPLDAYHSRDLSRILPAIDLVTDIGCNMVRCWGGNVYENDLFYDLCDERGILVWQDFAMACAVYPQDDEFCGRIEAEARKVVRRLRNHPCIAVWGGDNECDQAYDWFQTGKDPNTNRLTRKVIPQVIATDVGAAPYLPSSPYYDHQSIQLRGTSEPATPEAHLWGPRNYYKSEFYTEFIAHFANEMGYHGCPSPESLAKFISPDNLWPYENNEEWILHCTSPIPGIDLFDYRVELMATQIRAVFGAVPENLADYCFASQAAQAEALKFFIETFRTQKWRRTGIIWWNIIDGWPQISDAVVDYYYNKKLAYPVIKRIQASLFVALREPDETNRQAIVAVNDTRDDLPLDFTVTSVDNAPFIKRKSIAAADSVTVLGYLPYDDTVQTFYSIRWSSSRGEGKNHYLAGKPPFSLHAYKKWFEAEGILDS